jgi:subtilisin family serine protease
VRVRVGIVDSGLYEEHEAFSGLHTVQGTNYCVSEENAARTDTSDSVGHGTFVTGLIAAGQGEVRGIAPNVEIVPLKCFDSKNSKISNVVAAIYGGVDTYHCDVLNMSFGTEIYAELKSLETAIVYASENGVILVAAAGNLTSTSTGNDPLVYPAAYDQVIGVGAVNQSRQVDLYSYQNASVFVTAPGRNLTGPDITAPTKYKTGSGTSYATPFVTAAVVLALEIDPTLTQADVEELLQATAEDLGEEGYDYAYGYGLLRIDRLLLTLLPSWKVTQTDDGWLLKSYLTGLQPLSTVIATVAFYRPDGGFLQTYLFEETVTEQGNLTVHIPNLPYLDDTAQIKILLLDDSFVPIREPWNSDFE